MNLKGDFPGHKVWTRALADIDRITKIWNECIEQYGGPFLFGAQRCMADAMYAPVATRFLTYHVKVDRTSLLYCSRIMAMPEMKEWTGGGEARAGRDRRARHGFLKPRSAARRTLRPVLRQQLPGAGTSHGAGASIDLKSAGPTTSRYSMSGE
jgi:glutathione S-transferase